MSEEQRTPADGSVQRKQQRSRRKKLATANQPSVEAADQAAPAASGPSSAVPTAKAARQRRAVRRSAAGSSRPARPSAVPAAAGSGANDDQAAAWHAVVQRLRNAPPWLVSGVLHFVMIVVMALITLRTNPPEERLTVLATEAVQDEVLEEITEFEIEAPEPVEIEETSLVEEFDPGEMSLGELAAPLDAQMSDLLDQFAASDMLNKVGSETGDDGSGLADEGEGVKGVAQFFGTKSQARRVLFIVDNSNSMGGGRLETALVELAKAVQQLSPKQYFYIIFFSDTAYPLFYPRPARQMIRATDDAKRATLQWLNTIEMCLKTNVSEAFQIARLMKPDVIYLLGDGAFTDKGGKELIQNPIPNCVIHVIGMEVKDKDQKEFRAIAEKHHGTYRDVGITEEGRALLKQFGPRKQNRTRGRIWGIKLPVNNDKK